MTGAGVVVDVGLADEILAIAVGEGVDYCGRGESGGKREGEKGCEGGREVHFGLDVLIVRSSGEF